MLYFYIIVALVIITSAAIILFKNFMSNFNGSEKLIVNVIIIGLMVISVFCALAVLLGVNQIFEAKAIINSNQTFVHDVRALYAQEIAIAEKRVPIYLIVSCIAFIISYVLLKKVKNESKNSKTNHNSKWDLDDYK